MKKICLQAGHRDLASGATGAPGEREWNAETVEKVAEILRNRDVEVHTTGYYAYLENIVKNTDWDLFLTLHYDADIYWVDPNDHSKGTMNGGFCDYPDESVDYAHKESKRISDEIGEYYFDKTTIPIHNERSNANTKFYYMWKHLSKKTPCVLLEAGVGWRKPQDYERLREDDIPKIIADAISKALNISTCPEELDAMRASRNKWRIEAKDYKKKYKDCTEKNNKIIALWNKIIDIIRPKKV